MKHRFFALFATIIVLAASITQTASAFTYDRNFFNINDIPLYDPRCSDIAETATRVQLAGKDNTEKILNFFMSSPRNLTLAQASGIVGNMMQESGLNPAIIQGGGLAPDDYVLVDGVGFGLVQWTSGGDPQSRQQKFMRYMKEIGAPINDLSGQLGFAWKEMNEGYPGMLRALKTTQDPQVAAVIVHGKSTIGSSNDKYVKGVAALAGASGYESSGDSGDAVVSVRGGNAQKVFDSKKDAPALAGSTADSEHQTSGSTTAQNVSLDGSAGKSCTNGDQEFDGGDLAATVKAYAWPDYKAGRTDQQKAYSQAIDKADKEKRYTGNMAAHGNDCGVFVTTLIHDSGIDTKYNSNPKGYTVVQEQWLKENWFFLGDKDKKNDPTGANQERQVGDVAINENHTYIYVGKVEGFHSVIASASYSDRAPMAGTESPKDPSFRWYRKGIKT